ncbi:MAG: hypothetical protein IAE87_17430 [Rhodobacteraceae bacterium]|nr:hypothetical protein [Paracoccaceae bacterium]
MIAVLRPLAAALALGAGAALGPALPAAAESAFGCSDLDARNRMAAVEGADGIFFRLLPDLAMDPAFSDETVLQMASLSQALAEGGTTFVYVPLPTRGLAMPHALPATAFDLGFDPALAASLYDDILTRLSERGIATANARSVLVGGPDKTPSFFGADPRLTSAGGARLAGAIATTLKDLAGVAELPRGKFETRSAGPVNLPSDMRTFLQRHCLAPLPPVSTETYATTRLGGASGGSGGLMGTATAPRIALLSHEDTGGTASNLAGFLSDSTGLDVLEYSVPGGNGFAAISSYMTSQAFREQRPAVLIWVNPIYESLAARGDQPMRELIAAAGPDCRQDLPIGQGTDGQTLIADISGLDPVRPGMLMVDTGGTPSLEMRFDFRGRDGTVRSRWITRDPAQIATGRFYVPADGLWPDGAATVDIHMAGAFGPSARVAACPEPTPSGAP